MVTCLTHRRHSRSLWFLADVIGLFSNNVVSFSRNVVLSSRLFSANVVRKRAMFLGQAIYVLGPLQLIGQARKAPAGNGVKTSFPA